MKLQSPQVRYWAYTGGALCALLCYAVAAYFVYGGMRIPRPVVDVAPISGGGGSKEIARVQKQIAELFLNEKDVAEIFTVVEGVSTKHGVSLAIDGVSNPTPSARATGVVSTIDVKLVSTGKLADSIAAVESLANQPYLIQIVSLEISEGKDAQAPTVNASLRFFVRPKKQSS